MDRDCRFCARCEARLEPGAVVHWWDGNPPAPGTITPTPKEIFCSELCLKLALEELKS